MCSEAPPRCSLSSGGPCGRCQLAPGHADLAVPSKGRAQAPRRRHGGISPTRTG